MASQLPFAVSKDETFYEGLSNWIGDVFYDLLPEQGFDLRDEQIFMAFQLERAFKDKSTMFAEAGVGTGKTLVYLLYAISYARYTGKPALIACADETLIEQLVKKEGDIAKISKHLGIDIDVRLSKSQEQYLCLKKLNKMAEKSDEEVYLDLHDALPDFVHDHAGMQRFTPYGDRKQSPGLTDAEWSNVSWDPFQDCLSCELRNRCGLTLSRDHYRKAGDVIICSHDFYMEHVWTKDSRKREGQLPLLPEHSCIIFDEGHLLEFAAQKALTYRVKKGTLLDLLEKILQNDVREETALLVEEALLLNDEFFYSLSDSLEQNEGSERRKILVNNPLIKRAQQLKGILAAISEALVFEGELYTVAGYDTAIVEEYLDQMEYSINLFSSGSSAISWVEMQDGDYSLVIMPKQVEEVLKEKVFSQKLPIIFSSATLSTAGSFDYLAKSLGIEAYDSFSVASPFEYEEQMKIFLQKESRFEEKRASALESISRSNGRTLVLFPDFMEMNKFKNSFSKELLPFPVYFEGDREISETVSDFQNEEASVLCAVHLWEGLDIPGESLSNVIIWALPYPPLDPVFEAKKDGAEDYFHEVELPYMILRLRQGIGRLIRTNEDKGEITIFADDDEKQEVLDEIFNILPVVPVLK
ncbi:ATP-dependent DNA helicase [Metabacillus sp. GX 13764]|uniref:ATP-dependent DNA helicase n=1 Tax=Metabacillus kandeliae TaxID=2900151 RepID=UPI001E50ECE9|nr:ATP-dependent DNA helicase [Metabacillus kandeliae]MCD7033421.1 ATP-dependent DNA helicase [Metabacillus kandeliae]